MRALAGRVAVVTGGSRGIGRAIARRLAAEGADCALTYRQNGAQAHAAVGEIEALGPRAIAVPLELAEPAEVAPAFERIGEALGRVDILVACAAATAFRPILEQKPHNVRRTLAISLESFVAAVQGAARLMTGPGRIIAISGIDSFQAMDGHGMLGAAKAGMESLVRALALELGPRGITVNGVNPGFVETDSLRYYVEQGLGRDYREAVAAPRGGDAGAPARNGGGRGGARRLPGLRCRVLPHRPSAGPRWRTYHRLAAESAGGRPPGCLAMTSFNLRRG